LLLDVDAQASICLGLLGPQLSEVIDQVHDVFQILAYAQLTPAAVT
jgi:hypothetical protein